jgi:hypothetical protein
MTGLADAIAAVQDLEQAQARMYAMFGLPPLSEQDKTTAERVWHVKAALAELEGHTSAELWTGLAWFAMSACQAELMREQCRPETGDDYARLIREFWEEQL